MVEKVMLRFLFVLSEQQTLRDDLLISLKTLGNHRITLLNDQLR